MSDVVVTSTANPAVKRIRSLRRRRIREETGLFFAEGIRIIGEAVELGAEIDTVVAAPELLTSPYGHEIAKRAGAPVLEVSASVFEAVSSKEGPQGIGAVIRQHWSRLSEVDPNQADCWVVLDRVQDPGNLGAVLRTSDAVGAAGVILTGPTTDPYDPASLRASMGSIFSQVLVRTEFEDLIRWTRAHRCLVVGTSDAGAADYRSIRYRRPLVLVMGSERQGLSSDQQAKCDVVVSIPMAGRSDSLNLAVATGVVLYEAFNQRRDDDLGVGRRERQAGSKARGS